MGFNSAFKGLKVFQEMQYSVSECDIACDQNIVRTISTLFSLDDRFGLIAKSGQCKQSIHQK